MNAAQDGRWGLVSVSNNYFRIKYKVCPQVIDSIGQALGYSGLIQTAASFFFIQLLMRSGCLRKRFNFNGGDDALLQVLKVKGLLAVVKRENQPQSS